ncbi:MAG: hypothetical protein Q9161_008885 [Pseudevernia consocians]
MNTRLASVEDHARHLNRDLKQLLNTTSAFISNRQKAIREDRANYNTIPRIPYATPLVKEISRGGLRFSSKSRPGAGGLVTQKLRGYRLSAIYPNPSDPLVIRV